MSSNTYLCVIVTLQTDVADCVPYMASDTYLCVIVTLQTDVADCVPYMASDTYLCVIVTLQTDVADCVQYMSYDTYLCVIVTLQTDARLLDTATVAVLVALTLDAAVVANPAEVTLTLVRMDALAVNTTFMTHWVTLVTSVGRELLCLTTYSLQGDSTAQWCQDSPDEWSVINILLSQSHWHVYPIR